MLEAKLVLHPKIIISIQTEFVDNENGEEYEKQDCERKACWRLMEKLGKEFAHLRVCLSADSLYACERFFKECEKRGWHYILRYKEGSIPSIAEEYGKLKKWEKNYQEKGVENGKWWYDYVTEIDYNGYKVNMMEYGESREQEYKKGKKKGSWKTVEKRFWFLTDLPISKKNVERLVERGRMRWKIENEGFNTQKKQGYYLEHQYSKKYRGIKNYYYLTQIGHMIAQLMEAWEKIWKGVSQSRKQKHRRILESMKGTRLEGFGKKIQIRLI